MRRSWFTLATLLLGALALVPLLMKVATAHDPQDEVLEQVGVDERLGATIQKDLTFRNQKGEQAQLSRYFSGKPVILTLNYFSCPTLCPLVFRNLAGTIGKLGDLSLGRDFRVVTVSIDPDETLQRAAEKSSRTYAMLPGVANPGNSWPFLLGRHDSIERLAAQAGVHYVKVGSEFAHPNVIIILTPDGRISRYLYGVEQTPQDLKLALIEAADGDIGSSKLINRAILYCFHYDPIGKKYVLFASRLMTGAMPTVLALMLGLVALYFMHLRHEKLVLGFALFPLVILALILMGTLTDVMFR
jgi:protein SCO1